MKPPGSEIPQVVVKWYAYAKWVLELVVKASHANDNNELLVKSNEGIEITRWVLRMAAATAILASTLVRKCDPGVVRGTMVGLIRCGGACRPTRRKRNLKQNVAQPCTCLLLTLIRFPEKIAGSGQVPAIAIHTDYFRER